MYQWCDLREYAYVTVPSKSNEIGGRKFRAEVCTLQHKGILQIAHFSLWLTTTSLLLLGTVTYMV